MKLNDSVILRQSENDEIRSMKQRESVIHPLIAEMNPFPNQRHFSFLKFGEFDSESIDKERSAMISDIDSVPFAAERESVEFNIGIGGYRHSVSWSTMTVMEQIVKQQLVSLEDGND